MGTSINSFYWILGILALGLTIKNFFQLKNLKRERIFSNTYSAVLRQDEDCYDQIKNFVAEEKIEWLKNKARIILAYEMMVKGEDPLDVINEFDLEPLFKEKKTFKPKLANRNSDIFVWYALIFAKARSLSMFDVIDKLSEKMNVYDEFLTNQLEYREYKGICSALAERNDDDSAFLTRLLEGEYQGMVYEQRLIGLYKRIAACYLVFMGDTIDELSSEDLHAFAETLVGKRLMKDLEIYDKYPPIEVKEETEEKTEEVKEETTEETKE